MKLDYIEVCGFRGFRGKVRITFGAGFTVLTGRNGVGKSTLCDAVEYALTGGIAKYAVETSAKERLDNYLWWRGEGSPPACYVTAAFIADAGEPFVITRRRGSGADKTDAEILQTMCSGPVPDDALKQLCKTSIIRDEWIAALSLDLTETERFDLVRAALGATEGGDLGDKADQVLKSARAAYEKSEADYNSVRDGLNELLTQQSEVRDAASRVGDLNEAFNFLAAATPDGSGDLADRLAVGRRALAERRARLGAMGEGARIAREALSARQAFDSPDQVQLRTEIRGNLARALGAWDAAMAAVENARVALGREEAADAVAASLATLIEHGAKLGRHDDRCPLCAAVRTEPEFQAGLAQARARLDAMSSGVDAARQALSAAEAAAQTARADYDASNQRAADIEAEARAIAQREQATKEFFNQAGLNSALASDPSGLDARASAERHALIDLERALLTLEASQAVSRISALEDQITQRRELSNAASDAVAAAQAAFTAAREIERSVRRVGAEIIDERLAQISPLLNELYQRLRPHAAWRTIDYRIRGDVRRFLSLKVGDDLNPQFVFSSGQRRAAGLAFLLSVHLARAWTQWRTLLLDDPVQHIDDFRAVQLVEVLAALRLDGRQIICAVEDGDLADLLCRRLISTPEAPGRRYDIGLGEEGVSLIIAQSEVPPLPLDALGKGSGLQAIG